MTDQFHQRYLDALDRAISRIEEHDELDARGELVPSPNPSGGPPLLKIAYKRKDRDVWLPASFAGFDKDTGAYVESVGYIYVETRHGLGCEICDRDEPPFLVIDGREEGADVSACLNCVRFALEEYEK